MKDIETEIFATVAKTLRAKFSENTVSVSGEYINAPSSFPYVSLVEQDNYVTRNHLDTSDTPRYAHVMYEVNVYSNKAIGKKTEAKNIMSVIDDVMYSLNFTRISQTPVPNLENASIYRLVARYTAETDGFSMYRR